jgi:hypothetical protein
LNLRWRKCWDTGGDGIMMSFTKCYNGDEVKGDDITRCARHVARMGQMRNAYEFLVGILKREETTRKT